MLAERAQHSNSHYRARYRQIASVLARHGLGSLLGVLDLERFVPPRLRLRGESNGAASPAQHLRQAAAELGPTFIKLAQILSTRPDLLPPEYQAELARLQDQAPPFADSAARALLTGELGRPLEEVFASFDFTPLAAASIGQAHAATLKDGREVVVKLRRPQVVEQVELDLEIIQNLAATASRRWQWAAAYDPIGLAQEFAQTLRAELDYIREGRNAERFAANFAGDSSVHIPRVFWETTTSRMLTLERIRGIKIDDLAGLDAAGIDRSALARRAVRLLLQMVFHDGYFHADPHPGNFFVEPDGRIGLIDFGMVGTLDERLQEELLQVLLAVVSRNGEQLVDTLLALGLARRHIDRDLLQRDLEHLINRYYDAALAQIDVARLLEEIFAIVRHHQLVLPANLALLSKTLLMNEGMGARLDPGFSLTHEVAPYLRDFVISQQSPRRWVQRISRAGVDAALLGLDLPQQLRRLLNDLQQGSLELSVKPANIEPVVRRFERLANRITLGVVTAAFVVGLAVLLAVYEPPGLRDWIGVFFAIGFFAATGLGIYLAWSILRSGRG